VRRRFDPLAGTIAAHITLVFPFESDLSSGALRTHVASALAGVPIFQVELARVRTSGEEYIYLDVGEGRQDVVALHGRLHTGPLARHLSHEHPYEPHVTVGRTADKHAREEAFAYAAATLADSLATIREVVVFRLDGPDQGEAESTVQLGLSAQAERTRSPFGDA
jgi:2'-5' RNA ligase